jgi:AraC-like DNA-binding protein
MDVLTDVLHATRLAGKLFCRLELTPPWTIGLSVQGGANFQVVERGSCWLRLSGESTLIPLAVGDLTVLPQAVSYELLDNPNTTAVRPFEEILAAQNGRGKDEPSPDRSGPPATLIFGEFRFEQGGTHPLFSMLPALIHVRGQDGEAVEWLSAALHFISQEAALKQPGYETTLSRLTDILFIMVLRHWIAHHPDRQGGWLNALHDPQIALALGAIHRSPGTAWTVEKLASQCNMSRSAFAARFHELVGEPPLKYLTRWRMQLAMNRLNDNQLSLDTIARQIGYESTYAFGKAFKRSVKLAPGEYRKQQRSVQAR